MNDPCQKLFVPCKECGSPCIPLHGGLCKVHEKPVVFSPKAPERGSYQSLGAHKLQRLGLKTVSVPRTNGDGPRTLLKPAPASDCLALPSLADYNPAPSVPLAVAPSEDSSPSRPSGKGIISDLRFPSSAALQLASKKFVVNCRPLARPHVADSMYSIEQKKLRLADDCTVIDDDIPLMELEHQMKPVAEPKVARTNGHSLTNGPVAIFQNGKPVDRWVNRFLLYWLPCSRVVQRGRNGLPATIQTNVGRRFVSYNLSTTCARTRPFVSSQDNLQLMGLQNAQEDPTRRAFPRRRDSLIMRNVRSPHVRGFQFTPHPVTLDKNCFILPAVSNIVRQNNGSPVVLGSQARGRVSNISYVQHGASVPAVP